MTGLGTTAVGVGSALLGAWHDRLVIEELRAAADALNRGDPEPFVSLIAADSEWRGVPHGRLWWKRTPA
jgi:hypothetical protein